MKTRILYQALFPGAKPGDFVMRAFLPEDSEAARGQAVARFEAKHKYKYTRLGDPTKRTGRQHDSIIIGSYRYRAWWHKPMNNAVVLSTEDLTELERQDALVARATQNRREFMIKAAKRSRGLRIDDLLDEEAEAS